MVLNFIYATLPNPSVQTAGDCRSSLSSLLLTLGSITAQLVLLELTSVCPMSLFHITHSTTSADTWSVPTSQLLSSVSPFSTFKLQAFVTIKGKHCTGSHIYCHTLPRLPGTCIVSNKLFLSAHWLPQKISKSQLLFRKAKLSAD